jgi:CSLREA domain-containing protein
MSHQKPSSIRKTFYALFSAILLLGLALVLTPASAAPSAIIVVNTTDDEYNTDPAECSLREAIQAANTNAAFGGCSAGSGADTITLPAGTYLLTIPGAGTGNASGDLDLTGITIDGAGASTTIIDGNQLDRVIEVLSGYTATLNDVTITNGKGPNGTYQDCGGGGVHNSGTLTLQNSVVSNNTPGYITGASYTDDGCFGGGVYSDGTLTIENTTIRDNSAGDANGSLFGGYGGGVYIESGTAAIQDSTISGNLTGDGSPDGYGGGVFNQGTLTIENSTLSGNNSGDGSGGGTYNSSGGTLTLIHSTITGNTANDSGGGIKGGAVRSTSRTPSLLATMALLILGMIVQVRLHHRATIWWVREPAVPSVGRVTRPPVIPDSAPCKITAGQPKLMPCWTTARPWMLFPTGSMAAVLPTLPTNAARHAPITLAEAAMLEPMRARLRSLCSARQGIPSPTAALTISATSTRAR